MPLTASKTSTFLLVLIALFVVQFGFGLYGVIVTKFAKKANVDPLVFCLIRDGGCFPILFLAAYVAEKKIIWPNKRDWPLLISFGFIGMFLNQLMYLLGVYYTSPDIASIFQPIASVWTVIVAVLLKVEAVPKVNTIVGSMKVLGILLAVAGGVMMNLGKSSLAKKSAAKNNSTGESVFGYIALLINTLSISIYVVLQKKYIFNAPTSRWREYPINITAWSYFFGFVSMAIASLYYVNQPEKFQINDVTVIYTFVYAVFITSALCYMLITWCNMLVSSTLVTASWPLQVFICIISSYLILGEVLSAVEYAGAALIIVAMLMVVWSNYRSEVENNVVHVNYKEINEDDQYED